MADPTLPVENGVTTISPAAAPPASLDEARAKARTRFKERLERGEKIGECDCADDSSAARSDADTASGKRVAGVRFLDSGRTYYFEPRHLTLDIGDWVVVETNRGKEAGRVVIAPHQVRASLLQGELKPILRVLGESDVQKMDRLKRESARAIRSFGAMARERKLAMKPISAEYNFDGSLLTLNFSAGERVDFREFAKELSQTFRCRVELRQVGPRDEARLLGGLGRCGRTLCCSSWLPVFPEISMNMAKTQDLPLNPGKVSGVCGRLLCCLSYENEQYKQMKVLMPRLGQSVETPQGPGMVVALQLLKELVTVRLASDNTELVLSTIDFGLRKPEPVAVAVAAVAERVAVEAAPSAPAVDEAEDETDDEATPESGMAAEASSSGRGRRRRRRGRAGGRRRGEGGGERPAS